MVAGRCYIIVAYSCLVFHVVVVVAVAVVVAVVVVVVVVAVVVAVVVVVVVVVGGGVVVVVVAGGGSCRWSLLALYSGQNNKNPYAPWDDCVFTCMNGLNFLVNVGKYAVRPMGHLGQFTNLPTLVIPNIAGWKTSNFE